MNIKIMLSYVNVLLECIGCTVLRVAYGFLLVDQSPLVTCAMHSGRELAKEVLPYQAQI